MVARIEIYFLNSTEIPFRELALKQRDNKFKTTNPDVHFIKNFISFTLYMIKYKKLLNNPLNSHKT